jgi:hypothetical protein
MKLEDLQVDHLKWKAAKLGFQLSEIPAVWQRLLSSFWGGLPGNFRNPPRCHQISRRGGLKRDSLA